MWIHIEKTVNELTKENEQVHNFLSKLKKEKAVKAVKLKKL